MRIAMRTSHDGAVAEFDHPVRDVDERGIVGGHDRGDPLVVHEVANEMHDRAASGRVELTRRFVGDQHARVVRARSGDGDTPLLTPNDGPTGGSTVSGRISSHWVPTIESDLPNVRTALSVSPGEMAMQGNVLDAFYVPGGALALDLDAKVWSLERTQLELVAARVSTLNECFY